MKTYINKMHFVLIVLLLFVQFTFANSEIPNEILKMEDSLLYEIAISDNDSIKAELMYELSHNIYYYDYLKGLKYIDQSIKLAEDIKEKELVIYGYYLRAIIYYYMSYFDRSLEELFKAESINKEYGSDLLYANIYNYMGICYKSLNQPQKALFYYKQSNKYCIKINDKKRLSFTYNNIGNLLSDKEKYDSALYFYGKALLNYESENIRNRFSTYLNEINIFLKTGKLDLAFKKLEIANALEPKLRSFDNIAELYYFNGLYYKTIRRHGDAIKYFNKSINICKDKNFWQIMSLSAEHLTEIYLEKQDYKNAFTAKNIVRQASDSLNFMQTKTNVVSVEAKNKYDRYLVELELKERKEKFGYLVYSVFLLISLNVIVILFYRQRRNIKFKKKEYEIKKQLFNSELKNASLEKKRLRDELKFKNNEIMNFALQLVHENDFIKNVMRKIKSLKMNLTKKENIKSTDDITVYINQNMDIDRARKEFYMDIEILNKAFFHNLTQRFPNLTKNEKRLALLLRLNFSSKKIAVLLNISVHTVDSNRYRLRKKMDIDTKINLSEYFNSL